VSLRARRAKAWATPASSSSEVGLRRESRDTDVVPVMMVATVRMMTTVRTSRKRMMMMMMIGGHGPDPCAAALAA
jgi:hypothetical protein